MLPARMQLYTRACAALRRLNPCWTYIWNAWKRAVNQSGYGYLVDEAIRCTEERLHKNSLSLQEVSDYVHISPGYLSKKLKESTGLLFQELLIKMRMERAAALLRDGHMLVYEAAERLGYQNYRSFSAAFEKYYHCNPKKFKG